MIHGTGGGFSQGLGFAHGLIAAGYLGHRPVALRLSSFGLA